MYKKKRTNDDKPLLPKEEPKKERKLHIFEVKANQQLEAFDVLEEAILLLLRKETALSDEEIIERCDTIRPLCTDRIFRFKEETILARLYSLMCKKTIVFFMDGKWRLPPENINFKLLEAPPLKMIRQRIYHKNLFVKPNSVEGIFKYLGVSISKEDFHEIKQRLNIPICSFEDFIPYYAEKLWEMWVTDLEDECCDCTDFRVHRGAVDMGRWFLLKLSKCHSVAEVMQLNLLMNNYPLPPEHNTELIKAQMKRFAEIQQAGIRVGHKKYA